jgi:hypothetical protein
VYFCPAENGHWVGDCCATRLPHRRVVCQRHRHVVSNAGALWQKIAQELSPLLWFCPLGCLVANTSRADHATACLRRAATANQLISLTTASVPTVGKRHVLFVSKFHCIRLLTTFVNGSPVSFDAKTFYPTNATGPIKVFILIRSDLFRVDTSVTLKSVGPVQTARQVLIDQDIALCLPAISVQVTFEDPSCQTPLRADAPTLAATPAGQTTTC